MDIRSLGEFGLIKLLAQDTIIDPKSVVVGIGDDAAAVIPGEGLLQLLTTDMLVEGIHFKREWTSFFDLGYKAIAVNISDIAAMGGIPKHALISVALPPAGQADEIIALYDGMKKCCQKYQVNIVGGDTVASAEGLVINVTLIGEVESDLMVRRSGARLGDIVAVTGTLGDSAGGLELLRLKGQGQAVHPLLRAHLCPEPQVKAGKVLAMAGATSMNDISDGLASEINEIAQASGVGIIIEASDIPLSEALRQHAGNKALQFALYGGEDYQLVFTMPVQQLTSLVANGNIGAEITPIGVVCVEEQVLLRYADGQVTALTPQGYNHFR